MLGDFCASILDVLICLCKTHDIIPHTQIVFQSYADKITV